MVTLPLSWSPSDDHGPNVQKFYLGLALDPKYVEGFVEGCLERIGEDEP
jgi:hypothetical protein